MDTIKKFIVERGLTLMLCGMGITIVGVVSYTLMKQRWGIFSESLWRHAAISLAFVGLAVYVIGRVSVIMQRKRRAKTPERPLGDDE